MIYSPPSQPFEAVAQGFPTGLVGTIGVRIVDNIGNTVLARTTAGIVETPAGTGIYAATLTAPATTGQYTVVWDYPPASPSETAADELIVLTDVAVTVVTPPNVSPTTQTTLAEFVDELKSRGFDGFSDADLKKYVNRGYFHIARKYPHYWKQTTDEFTVAPPNYTVDLGVELPNYHHVERVYIVSPDTARRKLRPLSEPEFFEKWLPLDQGIQGNQGTPEGYFVYNGKLWVTPSPNTSTDFVAHYSRRVTEMVDNTDTPITPPHLDEAILIAALVRCHKRANEPGLAALAEADLQEFFDDMLDDDEELYAEEPERVRPDNQWL